jgi:hypothetical protein
VLWFCLFLGTRICQLNFQPTFLTRKKGGGGLRSKFNNVFCAIFITSEVARKIGICLYRFKEYRIAYTQNIIIKLLIICSKMYSKVGEYRTLKWEWLHSMKHANCGKGTKID